MEWPEDFSATMTKALIQKANQPPPDFYVPGDSRFPQGASTTYRGGGREMTRRQYTDPVTYPEGPAYYAKGPFATSLKEMRPAGVSTKAFAEVNMKDFVGYKENYYERERVENPAQTKAHDILTNKMIPPVAPPEVRTFPVNRLVEGVNGHPVQQGKLINLESGSERGNHF